MPVERQRDWLLAHLWCLTRVACLGLERLVASRGNGDSIAFRRKLVSTEGQSALHKASPTTRFADMTGLNEVNSHTGTSIECVDAVNYSVT